MRNTTSVYSFDSTRLPPVVENFRYADTIGRSKDKNKGVPLYDTTPAQVISLSVVMPGCSPGLSLQQMYCNQSKPSCQNHEFDKKLTVL